MEKFWNLSKLYTSFEDDKLKKDLAAVEVGIAELAYFVEKALRSSDSAFEKLMHYFSLTDTLLSKMDMINNFANLTYAVDTTNSLALKLIERIESYTPKLNGVKVSFRRWLLTIDDLEALLEHNNELKVYAFAIRTQKSLADYMLSDAEEALLSEMKNTGSNAWSKLQDYTIATLTVPFNGKDEPMTVIRNMAYSKDPAVRHSAYDAELKAYEKIAQTSASCLNAIKGEVITECKKRGYKTPLQMTLMSARMDDITLDAMIQAIESYLPLFRSYLLRKSKRLGHSDALPFYDLFAPVGETDLRFTYEEATTFIVEHFSTFSPKLGAYAQKAFHESWIDVEPRPGKVAGAFCSNIHGIQESRIMTNFTGSFNDVSTLAHELGHGYHGDCLKHVDFANSDYPMPLAETASIFCETIITHAALEKADEAQRLAILENSIMGSTQVIVDIYSRYLFETKLFEMRKASSLSVDELKSNMLEAQKKAYGDGLDENFLHPYMWACKPHYYDADFNFYNFPYAFGLLFAKGLYAKYLEMGDKFLPLYDRLLKATGNHSIKEVLAIVGVDAHSSEFFKGSLDIIAKEIEMFNKM